MCLYKILKLTYSILNKALIIIIIKILFLAASGQDSHNEDAKRGS
jgi:hypothetical protein